jgi:hypothetical protein
MKKIHSLLNYLMGAFVLIAAYQAFFKYPEYGTKLLSLTGNHQTSYSPTVILSTLTALTKSGMYFYHKTLSMVKRKKQRKQLLFVIAAALVIYFLPVITQTYHQFFG